MIVDRNYRSQVSFPLGALFGQNMTAMRLAVLELTGGSLGKTLRGTSVCLYLRHS